MNGSYSGAKAFNGPREGEKVGKLARICHLMFAEPQEKDVWENRHTADVLKRFCCINQLSGQESEY